MVDTDGRLSGVTGWEGRASREREGCREESVGQWGQTGREEDTAMVDVMGEGIGSDW